MLLTKILKYENTVRKICTILLKLRKHVKVSIKRLIYVCYSLKLIRIFKNWKIGDYTLTNMKNK